MNIDVRRVAPGFYTSKALGYKIRIIRVRVTGGRAHWQAESPDESFPLFIGDTKAAVIKQVNTYLEGKLQR